MIRKQGITVGTLVAVTVLMLNLLVPGSIVFSQPVYPDQFATTQPMNAHSTPTANSANTSFSVGTTSSRVPAGTFLKVIFNSKMDARITETGEPFNAFLADDFTDLTQGLERVILPKGTIIRGRVDKVQRPGYFSRGGAIFLTFDHAMAPSGELIPLKLNLSTQNTEVNKQGALYADPGIPTKLRSSVDYGVKTFEKSVEFGLEAGKETADGLGTIVTVPVAVAGGAVVGAVMTTGKAAKAVIGKGDTVTIDPGDSVTIDFGGSFTLPSV